MVLFLSNDFWRGVVVGIHLAKVHERRAYIQHSRTNNRRDTTQDRASISLFVVSRHPPQKKGLTPLGDEAMVVEAGAGRETHDVPRPP